MTPRILFFDIDGTLLATGGAGQMAMERVLNEEFRINYPLKGLRMAGRTDIGIINEIFDRFAIRHSVSEMSRFRDAYLERLPECLATLSGRILPGVRELLARLAGQKDIKLALLTGNYSLGAWEKLKHFDLDCYFEFGGFGDVHADRNLVAADAKAAAESALGLSISGQQCCVIGDTPADIACGRSIGAAAVAVATGTYSSDELQVHQPDQLFEDFSDIDESIGRILAF